jgi:hypothetical protein
LVELYNEVTCGAYVSASLFWQGLEIPSFKHFISNSRTHTLPREMGEKADSAPKRITASRPQRSRKLYLNLTLEINRLPRLKLDLECSHAHIL